MTPGSECVTAMISTISSSVSQPCFSTNSRCMTGTMAIPPPSVTADIQKKSQASEWSRQFSFIAAGLKKEEGRQMPSLSFRQPVYGYLAMTRAISRTLFE